MQTLILSEYLDAFLLSVSRFIELLFSLPLSLKTLANLVELIQQQESSNRTVSLLTSILIDLKRIHLIINPDDSGTIKSFKTAVVEYFDAQYSAVTSDTLLIAGLLDPRIRSRILETVAPHAVNLLKKKVEELSQTRPKDDLFPHTANCEVDRYLKEEVRTEGPLNLLKWWDNRNSTYPLLSRLAKHYLDIPLASFNTQLRLKPLRKSDQAKSTSPNWPSTTLPDGLNLPNYFDAFAQLKMNLSTEDMLIYTFLWHNWHLQSNQVCRISILLLIII